MEREINREDRDKSWGEREMVERDERSGKRDEGERNGGKR